MSTPEALRAVVADRTMLRQFVGPKISAVSILADEYTKAHDGGFADRCQAVDIADQLADAVTELVNTWKESWTQIPRPG